MPEQSCSQAFVMAAARKSPRRHPSTFGSEFQGALESKEILERGRCYKNPR